MSSRKRSTEMIEFNYLLDNFEGILFHSPKFARGEKVEIDYRFDCPEFEELKRRYPIERVAGKGGDFERALRLCRWLAPRLRHESNYDNHVPCDSLSLLDYCFEKPDVGINCLNKAKILSECCLAIGIHARRVGGMPLSPYDGDNHVVAEIFDRKRGKWIALDPTYGSYFSDGKQPLDWLELRADFAQRRDASAVMNRQSTADIRALAQRNVGVNWYYAKNSYYFFLETVSTFGDPEECEVVYVLPEGFDLRAQRIRNLEYRGAKYGEDVSEAIARNQTIGFRVASPALWDSPIRESRLR